MCKLCVHECVYFCKILLHVRQLLGNVSIKYIYIYIYNVVFLYPYLHTYTYTHTCPCALAHVISNLFLSVILTQTKYHFKCAFVFESNCDLFSILKMQETRERKYIFNDVYNFPAPMT
jgi:hypothetical protein